MKRNILYVEQTDFEAVLDLDKATSIQRYHNRIVIHIAHYETFTIFDDKEPEFEIVNAYFETLRDGRLKLRDLMSSSEKEESIHQFRQQGE